MSLTKAELAHDNIWMQVCEQSGQGCICGYHDRPARHATDLEITEIQRRLAMKKGIQIYETTLEWEPHQVCAGCTRTKWPRVINTTLCLDCWTGHALEHQVVGKA